MSWSIGYDHNWHRDIGYGVPATCDHPGCGKEINRGLVHVCCAQQPCGGDGCGLYFCSDHMYHSATQSSIGGTAKCLRCLYDDTPFEPTPDTAEWIEHKETHESWAAWRAEQQLAQRRQAPMSEETLRLPRYAEADPIEQFAASSDKPDCSCDHCSAFFKLGSTHHNRLCDVCSETWRRNNERFGQ